MRLGILLVAASVCSLDGSALGTEKSLVPEWMTSLLEVREKINNFAIVEFRPKFKRGGDSYLNSVKDRLSESQPESLDKSKKNRIVYEMISFLQSVGKNRRKIGDVHFFRFLRMLGILDSLSDVSPETIIVDFEDAFKKYPKNIDKGIAAMKAILEWTNMCTDSDQIIFESLRIIGRLSLVPYDIGTYSSIIVHAQEYQNERDKHSSNDCGEIKRLFGEANLHKIRSHFINDVRNLTQNKFLEHVQFDPPHHL